MKKILSFSFVVLIALIKVLKRPLWYLLCALFYITVFIAGAVVAGMLIKLL